MSARRLEETEENLVFQDFLQPYRNFMGDKAPRILQTIDDYSDMEKPNKTEIIN